MTTGEPPSPTVEARAEVTRLRAAGYEWTAIARSLNARAIPTPSGRGHWHPDTIKRHLNPDVWRDYMRRYRARRRAVGW